MLARERAEGMVVLATSAALLAMGIAVLYSAGQTDVPTAAGHLWERQLTFLGVGAVLAFLVSRMSLRLLEWLTPAAYVLGLVLLLLTLIVGTGAGTAAGARSWLAIGGTRIGQPSELVKLAVVLMLARHLAGRRGPPTTLWQLVPAGLIVGVAFVLVGLQPDLGSALVFISVLFAMLFWAGVSPWLLLFLASPLLSLLFAFSTLSWGIWIAVLTAVLFWQRPYVLEGLTVWLTNVGMGIMALTLWNRLAPYQQNRVLSFLNPEVDPRATGWHIIQSKVAIGSGGLLGKGFTQGTQKRLAFLPEQATDFIYSVVGEEFGFLGVFLSLLLFGLLLGTMVNIARRSRDPFSSLVIFGIVGVFFTHVVENIAMTVGMMPITGIPLPFFSYGGSFLLTCCIALGIVLRVAQDAGRAGYGD
ncbi:MAG: rod shape-determining protein RodA [Gemmatimonadota bacterium]|nr:rod shape-determining protein RodA [Gemmatimonadota bacterium]MDH5197399.1 rod shape-determining protein RodA [Gemmatimonadota bacterium]